MSEREFEEPEKTLYCRNCGTTNYIYDDMEPPYTCDDCGETLQDIETKIVICTRCGTANGIADDKAEFYECYKCKASLSEAERDNEIELDFYFPGEDTDKFEIYLVKKSSGIAKYSLAAGHASIMEDGEGSEYETAGSIDGKVFDELFEALPDLHIQKDIIGNYQNAERGGGSVGFRISAKGKYWGLDYYIYGINRNTMEKRGAAKLCGIVKRILQAVEADKKYWEKYL
jgi:hypothetical protein